MDKRCIVTGKAAELHHVKTRGSGGPDEEWNLVPVSRLIHSLWHSRGNTYMARTYPIIKKWLLEHGWTYDEYTKRWVHE